MLIPAVPSAPNAPIRLKLADMTNKRTMMSLVPDWHYFPNKAYDLSGFK